MPTQINDLNSEGQNIYAGFDAHLKSWQVTILTDGLNLKTFVMPPKPEVLSESGLSDGIPETSQAYGTK